MQPTLTTRQHYPALDGLRGLAILLVVFYHNFGFINYFFFGWLGVDLFFVLSGYLITSILLDNLGSKNYLRNFYMRRVLRIFPLYYLCLIIFLLIVPASNINLNVKYYTDNQVWLWTYFQNWLYILKPTNGPTNTLHHLWSLAVEEQFYLVWPLLILLFRRPKYLLWLMTAILLLVLFLRFYIWINKIEDLAYFNLYTFSRIDGICIGCMLALVQKINFDLLKRFTPVIILSLAAVNFIFYFFNSYYNFTFPYLAIAGYTTFAVMFALLIHEAVSGETKIINLLFDNTPMKFFGRISYGLYVFHWPVYVLINPFLLKWSNQYMSNFSSQIFASVTACIAGVIISVISFRYFESFFLRLKNRYS
jgi:peptidoglycan/LPS O-acetylase OafA/YrhL